MVVYKKLKRFGDDYLDLLGHKVILDSEFIINGELVSSDTRAWFGNSFKAIIPKGTKFWIRDDLGEIESERLYITSKIAKPKEETNFSSLYSSYCLDLLTYDGWRVSWDPDIDFRDIRGIYAYNSQAVSLEIQSVNYFLGSSSYRRMRFDSSALEDMKGIEQTKYLKDPSLKNLLKKNAYVPALGELREFFSNALFVNLTRKSLGLEILPSIDDFYWSSTPDTNNMEWCIYCSKFGFSFESRMSVSDGWVIPFISTTQQEKKWYQRLLEKLCV